MKIAKLTWLHNGNYGSVLQALALQQFLRNKNYSVVDLDYFPSSKTRLINWALSGNSPKLFVEKFEIFLKHRGSKYKLEFHNRLMKFDNFKKKYMKIEAPCTNSKQLFNVSKKYDLFICGSDQIWSPALLNPVFYFSFLPANKIKIAYSPSFGVTNVNNRKKKLIASYLKEIDYISVRENQGKSLVKKLIGIDVPVLIDPTLLLSCDEWAKFMSSTLEKKGKYIFCYMLTENKMYINKIKEFSKRKNMDVIIVPTEKGPFNTGFKELIDIGPDEWLSLISNSSYVFTDSFHGCIFSLIFHKKFVLFKRFSDKKKNSENSRIYTLAKKFGFDSMIIDSLNLNDIYHLKSLDYKKIDLKIKEEAKIAENWLLSAIRESESKIDGKHR